jgi:enoyl-CoA hydratase/carnithine racemase
LILDKKWEISEPQAEEAKPEELVKSDKTGNITLIGINRADVRNCVNFETATLLSHAIEVFENDPESPVAILYGIGGNFCSGYDLKEIAANKDAVSSLLLRSEGAMVS